MTEDVTAPKQIAVKGPIYAIVQREAVTHENGLPIVTDVGFLSSMQLNGERALLFFTSRDLADAFLQAKKDIALCAGTFRGLRELVSHLEALRSSWRWVMLNHLPGSSHGDLFRLEYFLEQLRSLLA
jgi:hypothetical protein